MKGTIKHAIPFEQYRAIDAVNWSTLKEIRKSPLHYRNALTAPREDKGYFNVGHGVHTVTLEPDKWNTDYVIWPDTAGRRYGKKWDAFKAQHEGKTILKEDEAERVLRCAKAIADHPEARKWIVTERANLAAEATLEWTDPVTGIKCKGRTDMVNTRIVDLKTAADVTPREFIRKAVNLQYHGQLGFYSMGLDACLVPRTEYPVIIVAESVAPFDVAVFRVPEETLDAGRELARRYLDRLAECQLLDEWPGVCPEGELEFELPAWAKPTTESTVFEVA